MTKKQKHLLQLLREVDEICRKHGLRYVMAGGSLIGVLRNEGFIPWDDDVDIYMPRDDWEKFVEIARTELPPDRAVQCLEADREYTNTFPRYADTSSCVIHKHQLIGNDKAGEIIDVLTLDPIPPDDREYERYRTHMMIYSELVNFSIVYGQRWEIPVTMYLKYLLSYTFLGKERTLKKLEKIMYSYKEEDCNRFAMRWGGCPFLFDKDMMFPVKDMNFEGEKVMVPQRTSDYLIWHYGDEWSYIPPHEERSSHDAITVEETDYRDFRREYMKKINKRRLRRNSIGRKFYYLLHAKKNHRLMEQRKLLQAKSMEMELLAVLREGGYRLRELVDRHQFETLLEIFKNYYQMQLSADFIGREDFRNIYQFYHPILLKLEDEVFWAAMMTLFYTEQVAKAYRMLQIREKLDHVTAEMQQLMEDVVLFRNAVCHYEMKEAEETEKICRELLERYPEHPGLLKLMCRILMERSDEAFEEAEEFVAKALKLFPEDGYFLKYKGDLLRKKGLEMQALERYADAREKTRNGIVHLEMDKLFIPYRQTAAAYCKELLAHRQKAEALSWAELWTRLLPQDEAVRGCLYLAKAAAAEKQSEMEEIMEEIRRKLEGTQKNAEDELTREEKEIYCEAMVRAARRLGYPKELGRLWSMMLCLREQSELEWLAEEIRGYQIYRESRAEVYKLIGDVRIRQGRTKEAFENYRKALEYAKPSYVKTELVRIFLKDLSEGSKKAASYAKRTDAADFLNDWLDKYGSIGDIQKLAKKLV